jgi:hypothetical protein
LLLKKIRTWFLFTSLQFFISSLCSTPPSSPHSGHPRPRLRRRGAAAVGARFLGHGGRSPVTHLHYFHRTRRHTRLPFLPPSPRVAHARCSTHCLYVRLRAHAGRVLAFLLRRAISSLTACCFLDCVARYAAPMDEAPSRGPPPSWADIPVELAGLVLGLLPAHVDRVRFAAVCPQWRAAARQGGMPPSMPMLLLPDTTVYSLP